MKYGKYAFEIRLKDDAILFWRCSAVFTPYPYGGKGASGEKYPIWPGDDPKNLSNFMRFPI